MEIIERWKSGRKFKNSTIIVCCPFWPRTQKTPETPQTTRGRQPFLKNKFPADCCGHFLILSAALYFIYLYSSTLFPWSHQVLWVLLTLAQLVVDRFPNKQSKHERQNLMPNSRALPFHWWFVPLLSGIRSSQTLLPPLLASSNFFLHLLLLIFGYSSLRVLAFAAKVGLKPD